MNKRPDFNLIDIEKIRKRKRRDLSDLERQEIQEAFRLFDTVRLIRLLINIIVLRILKVTCQSNCSENSLPKLNRKIVIKFNFNKILAFLLLAQVFKVTHSRLTQLGLITTSTKI